MKFHIIKENKSYLFWRFSILYIILVSMLCSCQRKPALTIYFDPSYSQDITDDLEVKNGKYQEALGRCQEKLKQVQPGSVEQADIFQMMGGIYAEYARDREHAVYYIKKAIEIDQKKGNDIELAEDYTAMSLVYIYTGGDASEGLDYLDEAEQIYKKYDSNSIRLAVVLINKSGLYQNEGQLEKALEVLKEARSIYDKNHEEDNIVCLLTGGVYLEQKEYKLAEEQYMEAQKICESKNDLYGAAVVQFQLGTLYSCMEEYEIAIEYYKKALEFYDKDNIYLNRVAGTYNNLADCYSELYMVDESTEAIIKANRLIRSIKPKTNSTEKDEKIYKHNMGMYYKGLTGDMSEAGFETWYTDVITDGKDWKKSLADEGKKIIVTSADDENGL